MRGRRSSPRPAHGSSGTSARRSPLSPSVGCGPGRPRAPTSARGIRPEASRARTPALKRGSGEARPLRAASAPSLFPWSTEHFPTGKLRTDPDPSSRHWSRAWPGGVARWIVAVGGVTPGGAQSSAASRSSMRMASLYAAEPAAPRSS